MLERDKQGVQAGKVGRFKVDNARQTNPVDFNLLLHLLQFLDRIEQRIPGLHVRYLQCRRLSLLYIFDVSSRKVFSFRLFANGVAGRSAPRSGSLVGRLTMMGEVRLG